MKASNDLSSNRVEENKYLAVFKGVLQHLKTAIINANELRVWHKSDSGSDREWHAYDPATGRSICVASEAEMRIWIDQNYYQ